MQPIIRNYDVITGQSDLDVIHKFSNFPVHMGCTDQPRDQDLVCDLELARSKSSGVLQLTRLIPLNILYAESHGSGSVGNLWRQHHQALAKFVDQYHPRKILEIGAQHGILANLYQKTRPCPWTIVDPNAEILDDSTQVIREFFSSATPIELDHTVVHSHLLEHIYDPCEFIRLLADKMQPGQKIILSVPDLREMLIRGHTNCLNFEHTLLLTQDLIIYLHSNLGFKLLGSEYFGQGHSIFMAFERSDPVPQPPYSAPEDLGLVYKHSVDSLNQMITDIHSWAETRGGFWLFGAHIFTQYLIAAGLNMTLVKGILDNDPGKQGLRLRGTDHRVYDPRVLTQDPRPCVVVTAGVYTREIIDQIQEITGSQAEIYSDDYFTLTQTSTELG